MYTNVLIYLLSLVLHIPSSPQNYIHPHIKPVRAKDDTGWIICSLLSLLPDL